ncbi:MAG: cyclic nucleotide-binding domain-containing protein [Oscillospiraceae bacterium]|nr:cyclic nucleotide-binding domain-containing protein [Oscillospiraceae bacterium]MCL2278902.1 cyclic nucleotide-binding domain-containing protein [Oscillospiraceae bacterium]
MVDMKKLAELSTTRQFRKGTILIKENDSVTPANLYIILKGQVGVYRNFSSGEKVQLAKLESGSFVGEMSLFLQEPRSATVVATEDCVVLELTENNVLEFLSSQPEFAYNMLVTLCRRLKDVNKKVSAPFKGAATTIPVIPGMELDA